MNSRTWVLKVSLAAFGAFLFAALAQAGSYSYQTIDNSGDPAFNQLLGINSSGEIAGYFGDGTVVLNDRYTVVWPYKQANFTAENFPKAPQTQVTGINSLSTPTTVGFWANATGTINFGWYNTGTAFVQIRTPSAQTGSVNQLLGVNNSDLAVGFYTDSSGKRPSIRVQHHD